MGKVRHTRYMEPKLTKMDAEYLKFWIERLHDHTSFIDCDYDHYSFEDLFDYGGEDPTVLWQNEPHMVRLLFARARNLASYGSYSLEEGKIDEAEWALVAGLDYVAEAALRIARPDDRDRYSSPPAKRGRKGVAPKLLYTLAQQIRVREDLTIVQACRAAIDRDPRLAVRYRSQSDTALRSAFKRGKKALEA